MTANHDHDIVGGLCHLCGWDGARGVRQRPLLRKEVAAARVDRAKRALRRRRGKAKYNDLPET